MPLNGTLETMPLPDLLRWLASSRASGTLQLEQNRVSKWILFQEGEIHGCGSDDPPQRLGQFLLSRGRITEAQLHIALASQENTRQPLGQILVAMGALRPDEVDGHLVAKAEETLLSIFDMSGARFQLYEGDTESVQWFPYRTTVDEVIQRGMARHREVQQISTLFDDDSLVLRRTDAVPPEEVLQNATARTVFEAIDGVRSIREILLHVHGSRFLVTKFLYELQRAGFAQIIPPETTDPEVEELDDEAWLDAALQEVTSRSSEAEADAAECLEELIDPALAAAAAGTPTVATTAAQAPSQVAETPPQVAEAQPQVVEAQPQVAEAQPQVAEAQPQVAEAPPTGRRSVTSASPPSTPSRKETSIAPRLTTIRAGYPRGASCGDRRPGTDLAVGVRLHRRSSTERRPQDAQGG